jgi:hypothetical protein
MRFALLGADVESLRLAEAAAAAGHAVVWTGDTSEDAAEPWTGPHGAAGRWEELLDAGAADAIIVGHGAGGEELRAHQLQELARLDRPMLVTFPLFGSVLTYFEIDMARGESGVILQHFNPLVEPGAVVDATEWLANGHPDLGAVEQIIAARTAADRNREMVLWHFARDVQLLDRIAGGLDRIGAHAGAEGQEVNYGALSVQLLGRSGIPVRWSVEPPSGSEGLSVTIVCRHGRVTFVFDASGKLTTAAAEEHGERAAIERFVAAAEANDASSTTWQQALHAMELTDSIEISLRRGRMIDVHHQQLTEHLAFKGTMAAAGCGLLFFLVPLFVALAWIAGKFGVPIGQFAPHIVGGLLAIFLAMQLLPKLIYPRPAAAKDADE